MIKKHLTARRNQRIAWVHLSIWALCYVNSPFSHLRWALDNNEQKVKRRRLCLCLLVPKRAGKFGASTFFGNGFRLRTPCSVCLQVSGVSIPFLLFDCCLENSFLFDAKIVQFVHTGVYQLSEPRLAMKDRRNQNWPGPWREL